MVRPGELELAKRLSRGLQTFSARHVPLPGIAEAARINTLVEQLVESDRRIRYMKAIRNRGVSDRPANPEDPSFNPLKGAVYFQQVGLLEEAFWMVFFFVHFGRHRSGGWRYARDVYRGAGAQLRWDWATTSADPQAFRLWLADNEEQIRNGEPPTGFGNHRKFLSLGAWTARGTGATFQTYIQWVTPPRTHAEFMAEKLQEADGDPRRAFRLLYDSMDSVANFGRLARFDYLATVSNLELANIEPDSPHLRDSSGPLCGARLLLGNEMSTSRMNDWLTELGEYLGLGMQTIEDALCNWQKSPQVFVPYRG